jgi:beta-barrel assembly-enhancing protease
MSLMRSTRLNCILALAVIAVALAGGTRANAAAIPPDLGASEVAEGQSAAAEVTKEYKLGDNAADLKRLREIGAKLADAVSKTVTTDAKGNPTTPPNYKFDILYGSPIVTPFEYKFDIIEDKDINAFCVPGGHVYVYRGLLNYVQSDDELALVLAHECTHAAHHHMVYLLRKQAAMENAEAIALLAAMAGGARASDVYNLQTGMMLLEIARVNGYGVQAERDADAGAIRYAIAAGYNPVGLLTFMERMARQPELVDAGIYRSHPLDAERVAAAKKLLSQLGVPINRRAVTNAISAEVKTEKIDGEDVPGVVIQDKLIYRPAPAAGKTSAQLAQEAAGRINAALDADVKIHELRLDSTASAVSAKGTVLVQVSDADAKLMNSTPSQVAQSIATAVRNVILMQMVDTVH